MITPDTFRILILVMSLLVKDNIRGFPYLVSKQKKEF
jgi:hypothetical protein